MPKIQPAVMRMWFHIDANNTRNYLDCSLAASAANRRFYRQGHEWVIASMSLHTPASVIGEFDVSKVPDTWVAENAYTKSRSLWMESQNQVLEDQPSIKAKYRDFKVFLDSEMSTASKQAVSNNPAVNNDILLPVDRNNQIAKYGEWVYSSIQLPQDGGAVAPDGVTLHFVGDDITGSKGMIHGYGLSRTRPMDVDPNMPGVGGWMNDVFDVADNLDEIREDLEEENNIPPYRVGNPGEDAEYYPGGSNNQTDGALHAVGFVSGTTVGGKTPIEGGIFKAGLVRFDWDFDTGTTEPVSMWLCVDFVPGTTKGYLTEAM